MNKVDAFEFKCSQYNDPDQKSGQHTNGPANIFVREDDSCPWYLVDRGIALHKVRSMIKELGLHKFQTRFCTRLVD